MSHGSRQVPQLGSWKDAGCCTNGHTQQQASQLVGFFSSIWTANVKASLWT